MGAGRVSVKNLREQEMCNAVLRAARLLSDDLNVHAFQITVKVQGRAIQVTPSWTAVELTLPAGADSIPPTDVY